MNDLSCSADIPIIINGNRKCTLTWDKHKDGIILTFPSKEPLHITSAVVTTLLCMSTSSKAAVLLNTPIIILPNTKKPVHSFIIDGINFEQASAHFPTVYQTHNIHHTVCGRHTVTHGPHLAVWSNRACTYIEDVENIVLQRTTGGMNTFDMHIVPKNGAIVTVEMLPHECMDTWKKCYSNCVLDTGADPISMHKLEQMRLEGGLRQDADSDADASMSSSGSDEYHTSSSMSESSSSECDPTSSESELEESYLESFDDDDSDLGSAASESHDSGHSE